VRSQVVRSLIIAYQEDTSGLERALAEEGLAPKVLRPTYTERELTYSRAIRCLLNHAAAWREARDPDGMTLIMEADFVPCTGFGRLPLPFDPQQQVDAAWAFLYTAGPRIFRCFPDGSLQGHSATPVAYVVTPRVACLLTDYVKEELARQGDLTRYSLWDTQFQWHIMGKGAACFMPYRSYGEHGGLPNAEHHREGIGVATRLRFLSRLGLGRNHHADALHGPLRFLPAYAAGNQGRFFLTRIEAKLTGWLKLLAGRVVAAEVSLPLNEQLRLRWMSLKRLCCFY
jgi:hypothetical protein